MGIDATLNIHAILPRSEANGPGTRLVIWVQGCTLACKGCFNPDTFSRAPRNLLSTEELFGLIRAAEPEVDGLTISGGEPLHQIEPLTRLLRRVRRETTLPVVLFTGYTLEQVSQMPLGRHLLATLDVMIDGRYEERHHLGRGLRGSSNQRVHLLTRRYSMDDILGTPVAEVQIDVRGGIRVSGFERGLFPGQRTPSASGRSG